MITRTRTLGTLEMIGGALCLDFTNTINSRRNPEHEYLATYPDLVDWAVIAGALSSLQGERLRKHETNAQQALEKAVACRELLWRLFSKLANGSEPVQEDMAAFVQLYAEAISHGALQRNGDFFQIDWKMDTTPDAILRPILHSAAQLLLSEKLARVKECPNCGWLFVDTSKNRNRRWCSMNTCGARDKMRRYHQKLRE